MSPIVTRVSSLKVRAHRLRRAHTTAFQRCLPAWLAAFLLITASPLFAQTPDFDPSFSVGAGIQTSYQHTEPDSGKDIDQFFLNHARLYFGGDVTKDISVMFNTDYSSTDQKMQILDAVGEYHPSAKFNIWFGRFLPPSDRANMYGPFYSHQWGPFNDGIQDGYVSVYQGRDTGGMYWGDFKAGIAKIKTSVGVFDGNSADGNTSLIWAGRVQIDFWDPENGYYLNGTYYGDKNLLAIAGATQYQDGKTATTVDFLLEKKVPTGGAFTIESEYSDYNKLGGYDGRFRDSQGAYVLASFLIPKQMGIGKFELLGKYAQAQFTRGTALSYHQKTTEVNLNYIIKQFDARVMSFYRNTDYTRGAPDSWEAGVGLQLQISKTFHAGSL